MDKEVLLVDVRLSEVLNVRLTARQMEILERVSDFHKIPVSTAARMMLNRGLVEELDSICEAEKDALAELVGDEAASDGLTERGES